MTPFDRSYTTFYGIFDAAYLSNGTISIHIYSIRRKWELVCDVSTGVYKKLSYRLQTARCCFVKLLRYCRTFCQTRKVWLPDAEKNSKICLFVLT